MVHKPAETIIIPGEGGLILYREKTGSHGDTEPKA